MNECESPQQVGQLLETLESDVARQIARARFQLNTIISETLNAFGQEIPESNGLKSTPKIAITKDGLQFEFWLEERYKRHVGDNQIKQTVLYVLPEDDTEGYEMLTVEGETLTDVNEDEIDDVKDIDNISKVLDFLKEKLGKAEQSGSIVYSTKFELNLPQT